MRRQCNTLRFLLTAALIAVTGCQPQQPFYFSEKHPSPAHYVDTGTEIEFPDVEAASLDEVRGAKAPLTLDNPKPEQLWDLTLEETVRIALTNATVVRTLQPNLTGTVLVGDVGQLSVPDNINRQSRNNLQLMTIYNPALEETNPRTGVEAALAAFDAQFSASLAYDNNRTPENVQANNPFITAFQPPLLKQEQATFQAQIAKLDATGGQLAIRNTSQFTKTNVDIVQFHNAWTTNLEAEIVQPFLRGAGVQYNRIAGPGAIPGFYNGVMIARLRMDQSLADFEANVRNMVADVEKAYWSVYYSYRRLDTSITFRDEALDIWRKVEARNDVDIQDKLEARGQYFTARTAVEQALSGLYRQEAALRYMMGLSSNDGRVIRPVDEPTTAKVDFDWCSTMSEALIRSPELRLQKWNIKQRELELIASKNWLLPQLNGVARYRALGLGHLLLDPDNDTSNAFGSMTSGDFSEWHVGLELSFPFGFRREMAGVRNAQVNLIRERKILQEQELEVVQLLSDAFRNVSQYYQSAQTAYNNWIAAQKELTARKAALDLALAKGAGGVTGFDILLGAQRRAADAEDRYYLSLAQYNVSIVGVHFRKGSLLEYDGVCLAEGPWPAKAYFDADRRAKQRDAAHYINYGFTMPKVVSRGPFNQQLGAGAIDPDGMEQVPGAVPGPAPELEPIAPGQPETIPLPPPLPSAPGANARRAAMPVARMPMRPESHVRGPRLAPAGAANRNSAATAPAAKNGRSLAINKLSAPANEPTPAKAAATGWTAPRTAANPAATSSDSAVKPASNEEPAASDGWKKPVRRL